MLAARRPRLRRDEGFTLIEIIVVITVIGILVAIIVPSFNAVQSQVREAATGADLGSNRTALVEYTIDNNGVVPPASGFDPRSSATDLIGYGWSQSPETTGYHYATNGTQTAWCLDMTSSTGTVFRITTNTSTTTGLCSAITPTSY